VADACRRCGHDHAAHDHYSAASYCALCGCRSFRRPRRSWRFWWRFWWRYRCALAALYADATKGGYDVSPATYERLKAEARETARQVRGE